MSRKLAGIVSVCLLLLMACTKEQLAPTVTLNEMISINDTSIKSIYSGKFESGPFGAASGKAEIYNQSSVYSLKLSEFSTTNGPALHLYLSKEPMPVTYIDLGVLKSTNGNQVYTITGMPDFMEYKYVSIHCVAYNHLFGSALIK